MPFMKVNLNGRKYVISGLNEHTSSKNILYSLARADSTVHLETTCTEFSDTSMECADRTTGTRIKRTRRTRVRRSSTSSVEIVQLDKDSLKGALAEKKLLIDLETLEWSEGQGITDITKTDNLSHVICTKCHATHPKSDSQCGNCKTKEVPESSSESQTQSNELSSCSHAKKTEVKRRKRKSRKRPVSQDVTGLKEKKDENNEKSNELEKKGWKSADDVGDQTTLSNQNEKPSKKQEEKHKRKQRSKHFHSNKIDKKLHKNADRKTITIGPIANPTEYRSMKRHVRKELGDLRIKKMITQTIDERFVDFHLACMKLCGAKPVNNHGNEQEMRAKLVQLVESQQKCLSALKKADKQNRKSMSRYTKYLKMDQDHLKVCGIDTAQVKPKADRTRKASDTDTGISEMHSDSSAEQTLEYEPNSVITDHPPMSSSSHSDIKNAKLDDQLEHNVNSKSGAIFEDDTTPNVFQKPLLPNYVMTVDAVAIDDVTHDVKAYVYEKDDDARSEIIVAEPAGVVAPSEMTCLVPHRSRSPSTLSDNSESSFHGDCDDVEELRKVLMQEQQKQRDKRRQLDRHYQEMKLMDKRKSEHEKMADILHRLKDLNEGLVENDGVENTDLLQEKTSLEKSIKLSVNLYEYQKGEINKNALNLEQIESQVRRKRWHVESAVREMERIASSPSRSQLDRFRSFKKLPAAIAGLTIGDVALHTLV